MLPLVVAFFGIHNIEGRRRCLLALIHFHSTELGLSPDTYNFSKNQFWPYIVHLFGDIVRNKSPFTSSARLLLAWILETQHFVG